MPLESPSTGKRLRGGGFRAAKTGTASGGATLRGKREICHVGSTRRFVQEKNLFAGKAKVVSNLSVQPVPAALDEPAAN